MKDCFLFLLIAVFRVEGSAVDPCTNYTFLNQEGFRGTRCLLYDAVVPLCDRGIESRWYAVMHNNSYLEMPRTCPPPFACGTSSPIWLNGTNPKANDGIVDQQLCVRGIYPNECCKNVIQAKMKNCGKHFVYKLSYTDICDYAYCFGDHKCPPKVYTNTSVIPTDSSIEDPCRTTKSIHQAGLRGTTCPVYKVDTPLCDRSISTGWFNVKVNGKHSDMPTKCVKGGSCGTSSPIWINGLLPSKPYQTVKRTACVSGFLPGQCCTKQYDIMVKNCISHNVYFLPYTETCDEGYCFGNNDCIFPKEKDDKKMTPEKIAIFASIGVIIILLGLIIILIAARLYFCPARWRKVTDKNPKKKPCTHVSDQTVTFPPNEPPPMYQNIFK